MNPDEQMDDGIATVDPEPTTSEPITADEGSILSRIRTEAERAKGPRSLTLPLPGYEDILAVRWRPVPEPQVKAIAKRYERNKSLNRERDTQVDTLIAACDEILYLDESGQPHRLQDVLPSKFGDDDEPVRFTDNRVLDLLQVTHPEQPSARAVFFKLVDDVIVIGHLHNRVMSWQAREDQGVSEEILEGESDGTS